MQQQVQAPVQRVSLLVLMRMFVLIRSLFARKETIKEKKTKTKIKIKTLNAKTILTTGVIKRMFT